LNIHLSAPSITSSISQLPNSAGWNNSDVTVTFHCTGGVPPVQCPSPQVVTTEDRNQRINGIARDSIGNVATTNVFVSLDKTPPVVNVTSPANGSNVGTAAVSIQGLAFDALSGVNGVSCAANAVITGTAFTCNVSLSLGSNTIPVTATDAAGNSVTSNVTLAYAPEFMQAMLVPVRAVETVETL
jgi:hypothetical protein